MRACAVEMQVNISQESLYMEIDSIDRTGKVPFSRTAAQTLCEPVQSKCTSTCHGAALYGNLQENAAPKNADTHFVRASLRSRNAHGHVTRGILCGNFQGKCRMLPIPPRLNTGP